MIKRYKMTDGEEKIYTNLPPFHLRLVFPVLHDMVLRSKRARGSMLVFSLCLINQVPAIREARGYIVGCSSGSLPLS